MTSVNLDTSGNISRMIYVADVELDPKYAKLQNLYAEVKVLSMTLSWRPSSAMQNPALIMGTFFMCTVHHDYAGQQSLSANQLCEIPSAKLFPASEIKTRSITWRYNSADGPEDTYYSSMGNVITSYIPKSLGGIIIFSDGPVPFYGTTAGEYSVKWELSLRSPRLT